MPRDAQNVIETVELTKIYRDFWAPFDAFMARSPVTAWVFFPVFAMLREFGTRREVKALDSLNLEVKRGEVFGLLGPNGSGKTTCVRLVLGLLFPTHGVVRIFGGNPRTVDVKRRVGYMPEESHLYEYLTARETLDFYGRLFGLGRAERKRRTDALIEMVGLARARNRPVGEFSKGMARRIGLAQALINDPDLLILDEPTTGLDPIGTREMKDLILLLKKRGKTVFLCSHLLADVEAVCDRICILYGGKARSMGDVADLLTRQDRMEIRMPTLPDEAVEQIRHIIRRSVGEHGLVEVGVPTRRLEEHFLGVVEEARRERLATAGAEVGARTAEFLTGVEEGKKLLDELVSAGKEPAATEAEKPAPVPLQAAGAGPDRSVLEGLVGGAEPKPPEREKKPGKTEPAAALDTGVRRDLIEDLTRSSRKPEQQEQPKDSGEDKA